MRTVGGSEQDGPYRQRPGEMLIAGGFGPRDDGRAGSQPGRRARRRSAARVAAPLAVPVALGVTLGIILAVSSGPAHTHVTQGNSGTTSTSTPARVTSPPAP